MHQRGSRYKIHLFTLPSLGAWAIFQVCSCPARPDRKNRLAYSDSGRSFQERLSGLSSRFFVKGWVHFRSLAGWIPSKGLQCSWGRVLPGCLWAGSVPMPTGSGSNHLSGQGIWSGSAHFLGYGLVFQVIPGPYNTPKEYFQIGNLTRGMSLFLARGNIPGKGQGVNRPDPSRSRGLMGLTPAEGYRYMGKRPGAC